jgi:hypothetical protein
VQGASLGAHAHALTDIIDVASATIMVKKEKRIVCARWYELLKPEGGIMISLWTA